MSIKQFELMHGAVLAKICRNENPVALTLIETDGSRAIYCVNDVFIYIKHATAFKTLKKSAETKWTFNFSPTHVSELATRMSKKRVFIALVCANGNIKEDMQIAFLEPDEVKQCLDISSGEQQNLTVGIEPNRQLRVYVKRGIEPILIERGRLDSWNVPNR